MLVPTQKAQRITKKTYQQLRTNGNAQKTHCQNGHEFNEENTYISPKSQKRTCKICTSTRVKERRQTEPEFIARNSQNMREWRAANKERDRKNWAELRRKKKEWLDSQKTPCAVCGESDIACLDFHHRDPAKKDATVSIAVAHWSIKRLQKEMAKCIIICSNCRRKLHAAEKAASESRVAISAS